MPWSPAGTLVGDGCAPDRPPRRAIALRILAAALVVLVALALRDWVLEEDGGAAATRGARVVDYGLAAG